VAAGSPLRAPTAIDPDALERIVHGALLEDIGSGDLTTEATVPAEARCRARLMLEEPGVVCGHEVVRAVFAVLDPAVEYRILLEDGGRVSQAPVEVAELEGNARATLSGERVALNLFGRMCGVASLTARYVAEVEGTGARLLDTRKTTPGLRALERYAVRVGGARNHREGLYDALLLKENHLRLAGGVAAALAAVAASSERPAEVEVETLAELAQALEAGATRILLDNMSPSLVAEAVGFCRGRALLEASGGITLETVRAYAETGVDFISIGALTRSVRALEVALEIV
jgi:nicotinate-nucleotide pyrophosphorylase (carboxylating)